MNNKSFLFHTNTYLIFSLVLGILGRGIFPTFALCNHSCVGNARFQLEAGNSIRVEARAAIKAGEEITVQYYR